MKIAICGCSFSAISTFKEFKGTHWSELLGKATNAEIFNFARQGISNPVIRLQINEAIKNNADFVFINATTPERIEFPVNRQDDTSKFVENTHEKGYFSERGLSNFNYNTGPYTMISETFFTVIDQPRHAYRLKKTNLAVKEAVENYAAFLFERDWKMQVDNWTINSGLWDLHYRKIPFLYNPWLINSDEEMHELPNWFTEKYFLPQEFHLQRIRDEEKVFFGEETYWDPGYHTTIEKQVMMANQYQKLMECQIDI